jgi:hypothetical protein
MLNASIIHIFTCFAASCFQHEIKKHNIFYIIYVPVLAEVTLLKIPIFVNSSNHHSKFQDHVFSGFFLHLVRLYSCHFVLLLKVLKNP